jgi:putative transposase
MRVVERHIITNNQGLQELCSKSKRLYNQCLYYLRQSLFGNIQRFTEYELMKLLAEYNDVDYRALPAQTSQQVIKLLFKNWWSWNKALKEYKAHPSRFQARPKMPNYKKEQFAVYFNNQQVRVKGGYVHFVSNVIIPLKTKVTNKIAQVRIIPQSTCHIIEVVYEKEITDLKLDQGNVVALDLGLSNLCTSINNAGVKPFIINGKALKAFNQWYNKTKAKLQSELGINLNTSKRINRLAHYRNCWIEDKLHKISKFIIDYCKAHNIGTIVVGKNEGWKTSINIGAKNNQHFTIMPLARLLAKIRYKAELIGIKYIETEESYTSKCDSLALEPIKKHEIYKGKRIKRGLFQSSTGRLINADGNGSINIARKVFGDGFVKSILNSRCAYEHYRVNVL